MISFYPRSPPAWHSQRGERLTLRLEPDPNRMAGRARLNIAAMSNAYTIYVSDYALYGLLFHGQGYCAGARFYSCIIDNKLDGD